jgi:hypothetical protein
MEIDEVRMSFTGPGPDGDRAQRVSRLIFEHVHTMMDGSLRDMEQGAEISYLGVGPIHVSFDAMDDETIAREGATEIYRALLQAT